MHRQRQYFSHVYRANQLDDGQGRGEKRKEEGGKQAK